MHMAEQTSNQNDFGEYQEEEDEISCTYKSADEAQEAVLKEILS